MACALHQSAESLPVWNERSKMTSIIVANVCRSSFRKSGFSLSGSAGLKGLMPGDSKLFHFGIRISDGFFNVSLVEAEGSKSRFRNKLHNISK